MNGVLQSVGVSNKKGHRREDLDYYATHPVAIKLLMDNAGELFDKDKDLIWEPCCGEGHLSKDLEMRGFKVYSADIVDRGYGEREDLFRSKFDKPCVVITNPPYGLMDEAVHSLLARENVRKAAFFLRILALEGKERYRFYKASPPYMVLISSGRVICARNGKFGDMKGSIQNYAWFIWDKTRKVEHTRLGWGGSIVMPREKTIGNRLFAMAQKQGKINSYIHGYTYDREGTDHYPHVHIGVPLSSNRYKNAKPDEQNRNFKTICTIRLRPDFVFTKGNLVYESKVMKWRRHNDLNAHDLEGALVWLNEDVEFAVIGNVLIPRGQQLLFNYMQSNPVSKNTDWERDLNEIGKFDVVMTAWKKLRGVRG